MRAPRMPRVKQIRRGLKLPQIRVRLRSLATNMAKIRSHKKK